MTHDIKAEMRRIIDAARAVHDALDASTARGIELQEEVGLLHERVRTLTAEVQARAPGKVMRAPFSISYINALGVHERRGLFASMEDAIAAALQERIHRRVVRVVGTDGAALLCFDETRNPIHGMVTLIREQEAELEKLRAELARRAA